TSACQFLLGLQQLEASLQPLFACSSLVYGHFSLLSFRSRCDLVFDCYALYLARGINGVGVTSVSGFGWDFPDYSCSSRPRGWRSHRSVEASRAARRCTCARVSRHREGTARRFRKSEGTPRRAARAFGPKEAVARARCIVAEAEIALASRDLGW